MRRQAPFTNRQEAGRALAQALAALHLADPVVLALPRGGVPVAAEVAKALNAPIDLVLVRKIGVPFQPELAAAAVVDGGDPVVVVNEDVVAEAGISEVYLQEAAKKELEEIERRRRIYLQGRERVPLEGRTLIVVDDGIATGASVRAALKALRQKRPTDLILAVPVAPASTVAILRREVDQLICLETPEPFIAIGLHYIDFHQMSDEEVIRVLSAAHSGEEPPGKRAAP